MQKVLHIAPEKCTGCLQCEMACAFENYGPFATAQSRIKAFGTRPALARQRVSGASTTRFFNANAPALRGVEREEVMRDPCNVE